MPINSNGRDFVLALSILDVKGFMTKLLKEEVFDDLIFKSAIVDTFVRFEVYGSGECATWNRVRGHVFDMIKGEKPPKSMKIILGWDVDGAAIESAASLFINIYFEGGKINLTTGMSKKTFTLDRSDDERWSNIVKGFLDGAEIRYASDV
jgi:hypothetical protein